jgi:hypothetical protein
MVPFLNLRGGGGLPEILQKVCKKITKWKMSNREEVDCTSVNIVTYRAANIVKIVYGLDMK